MKEYSRATTIDFYFEEIRNGRMELSKLRKVLEEKGIENDEIKVVYRQINKECRS